MIPRTYPTSVNTSTGSRQMVVFLLSSVTGLQRWVDYIPVAWSSSPLRESSTDTGGYMPVESLASTSGKQAWVDYVPCFVDSGATEAWQVSAAGYLPISGSGGNLLGDGTFPTDLSGWTKTAGGTSDVVWNTGAAQFLGDGANQVTLSRSFPTTPGTTYRVTFDLATNSLNSSVGTSATNASTVASSTYTVGTGKTYTFVATAATHWVNFHKSGATVSRLDNVVVSVAG